MIASRGPKMLLGGACALALLVCVPGEAAPAKFQKNRGPISLALPGSLGSFTPAAADPRRAAAYARGGIAGSGFRFTPSAAPGSRRAVTVAVRARSNAAAHAERTALASASPAAVMPMVYNLGISVGWKRFALSGDVGKVEGGLLPGDQESADIGLSFSGKKWSTRLLIGTDRATGTRNSLIGVDESYSVDLGGSYALTRNLELTGGLRYTSQHDRMKPITDDRRDGQAVYIGTAFRF